MQVQAVGVHTQVGQIGRSLNALSPQPTPLQQQTQRLVRVLALAFAGRRMKRLFEKPQAWRVLDGLTGVMMLALAWWVAGSVWAPAGA